MMADEPQCYCGSGLACAVCCDKYLNGSECPKTAETLMRSRYSAYVARRADYLLRTWHVSSRPAQLVLEPSENLQWFGLVIIDVKQGGAKDDSGVIEFVASYQTNQGEQRLHERSRFIKDEGQWFYLGGEIKKEMHARAEKIGRNVVCPCGSGKKYKRCCADSGSRC